MTRHIPGATGPQNVQGASSAPLPPGPGKARPSKAGGVNFASVMDEASARKAPAHARGTKSSESGIRGDRPHTGAARIREARAASDAKTVERPSRLAKNDPTTRPASSSRQERIAAKLSSQKRATHPEEVEGKEAGEKVTQSGTEPEKTSLSGTANPSAAAPVPPADPAPDASPPKEQAKAAAAETNIIAVTFPGVQPPAAGVIIPFPGVAAQAASSKATSKASALNSEVPVATSLVGNEAEEASATPDAARSSKQTSRPVRGAGESNSETDEADQGGAIDPTALGLQPVKESGRLNRTGETHEASSSKESTRTGAPEATANSTIIEVAFRPGQVKDRAESVNARDRELQTLQTQLPGAPRDAEETASQPTVSDPSATSAKIVLLRTDAAKAASDAGLPSPTPRAELPPDTAGTSAARQEVRMESTLASERDSAGNGRAGQFSEATAQFSAASRGSEHTASEVSERNIIAMDWQSGRAVSHPDQPLSEAEAQRETDGFATVERISTLLLREASLVKRHGSDSMAVVLRPDAETELFVHLSQRDGQVEASVRCERGDAQHLGALWSQLQESLAVQKVRLAPLESSPSAQSNFNQPPNSQSGGGQNGTRQETRPENQSMDEWPAPPASQPAAPHVRGTGGTRGRRTTTSRPGWETWA